MRAQGLIFPILQSQNEALRKCRNFVCKMPQLWLSTDFFFTNLIPKNRKLEQQILILTFLYMLWEAQRLPKTFASKKISDLIMLNPVS